jgi:pimeloyl-ACP methyl ester carboxylesterase
MVLRAATDDGVGLHIEVDGDGDPLLFIHEFAGDHRSWAPQVAHFAPRHRCITYAARGYPPSDVPDDPAAYSQQRAVADAVAVLDALEVQRAHVVGLSMGGFSALHLARLHPDRVRSAVVAGCGYGSAPAAQERFQGECKAIAAAFAQRGAAATAEGYALGPARVQLQNKNPDAWELFARQLAEHDARGAELTMLGVQRLRPSLHELADELARVTVPILIVAGDEDEGCLDTDLMLKRTIRSAALCVLPGTGHTCNLEDPETFNDVVERFLEAVDGGSWTERDPRSLGGSITGIDATEAGLIH